MLTRRTRISIETPDRGVEAAEAAAALMAAELGWDDARTREEIEAYRRRVEAELESQQMTEDEKADAMRAHATDIRTRAHG